MPENRPAGHQVLGARATLIQAAIAGLGLATVSASFLYAPLVQHGPILCPFRLLTGLPCPSCGLTRSFCAMSHGHLVQALTEHWMGPALFAATALAVPIFALQALARRRFGWVDRILYSKPIGYGLALGMVAFQCYRLASMTLGGHLISAMHSALPWTLTHMLAKAL